MLPHHLQKTKTFIEQYIEREGISPTFVEIALGTGLQSKGTAHTYVQHLARLGYLRLHKQHRGIELLPDPEFDKPTVNMVPLLGKIAAGKPIEAIVDQQELDLTTIFAGKGRFALKVQGDSMIEAGIFEGDFVICEACTHARDGEIVVALVDHQEATLKRILHNPNNTITLLPANPRYQPLTIPSDQVEIQGKLVGLVRTG